MNYKDIVNWEYGCIPSGHAVGYTSLDKKYFIRIVDKTGYYEITHNFSGKDEFLKLKIFDLTTEQKRVHLRTIIDSYFQ